MTFVILNLKTVLPTTTVVILMTITTWMPLNQILMMIQMMILKYLMMTTREMCQLKNTTAVSMTNKFTKKVF